MNSEIFSPITRKQQGRLKQLYPNLTSESQYQIPNNTNLIIDDLGITQEDKTLIQAEITNQIVFISPMDLIEVIQQRIDQLQDETLLVFPRNGALRVKDNLSVQQQFCTISISRDPSDLVFGRIIDDPEELLDQINTYKPESIEIIDDVIARGATVESIKKFTQSKTGSIYFWAAACWMMAYPAKSVRSPSGVNGMNQVTTSILYSGQDGRRTPLNSLSTWVLDDNKGPLILDNYATKYASCPNNFKEIISQLK